MKKKLMKLFIIFGNCGIASRTKYADPDGLWNVNVDIGMYII